MSEQLYTTSRLRAHARCPRYHHLRYDLGIHPVEEAGARDFGTAGHAALEQWFIALMQCLGLDAALAAALATIETSTLDAFDRAKLRVLVRGYHFKWGVDTVEKYEVIAVEEQFRYGLDDILVGGKLDVRVRDRHDGRFYVVEHKFTASNIGDGEFYWERLAIDTQCSNYVDGGSMLGHEIAGVVYDVIARPKHEPAKATPVEKRKYTKAKPCKGCGGATLKGELLKGYGCASCKQTGWQEEPRLYANMREVDETPEEFEARLVEVIAEKPDDIFKRGIVVRLDDELPKMRADLIDRVRLIQIGAERGMHPRNPENCRAYGSICGFFTACSGRADIEDRHQFPRGDAHPELAETK